MTNEDKLIRVEMSTNASAARLDGARQWAGRTVACRHDGGRTVVMTVRKEDLSAIQAALEAAHDVRGTRPERYRRSL